MKRIIGLSVLTACGLSAVGCGGAGLWGGDHKYVKPTVAVVKFENRAAFPMGWDLGDGMKDVLVDRLVRTRRYRVVERADLNEVLRELQFQHSGATRQHLRAPLGRLKNVRYLVKGVVTDFGHVSTRSGFLGTLGWDVLHGGSRAVMGITLQVVDVESGEIITSESIQESVRASDVSVKATYKGIAFGGRTFRQTPLGRATGKVIDKAVKRITGTIARRPWQPLIASVGTDGTVVLNGGANRRVKVGGEYEVIAVGSPILDPDSGDVIGRQPGRVLGRVRVFRVEPRCSVAQIVVGQLADVKVGCRCRLAEALAAK